VFENLTEEGKPDLTDSVGFLKIQKKIGEIQENSAETHQRQRRNSENREDRNSADFTDQSASFSQKSVRQFSDKFCRKSINEKTD
jgi:hypothetical protein